MMEEHRGPLIDPPYPQHTYRPAGVYHYPDLRADCQGRTIYEIWDDHECLICSSVAPRTRTLVEPRAWELYDLLTDRPASVAAGRHLRLV